MNGMYENLMQLPIFQGISRNKISELIEKTKFHFLKYPAGEQVIRKGEECTHLKFILSGKVLSEVISAPNVIAPNHLFGRSTFYPGDVFAVEDTGIMQVSKAAFVSILQNESIFLINLLNILSRRSQKTIESFLSISTGDVKERLAFWILSFTQRKSTDIRIVCKQKDLYSFFGVQRSIFMAALNDLKEKGIIDFTPQEIVILDRYKLKEILNMEQDDELEKG